MIKYRFGKWNLIVNFNYGLINIQENKVENIIHKMDITESILYMVYCGLVAK